MRLSPCATCEHVTAEVMTETGPCKIGHQKRRYQCRDKA